MMIKRNPLLGYCSVDELMSEIASRSKAVVLCRAVENRVTGDIELSCDYHGDVRILMEYIKSGEADPGS